MEQMTPIISNSCVMPLSISSYEFLGLKIPTISPRMSEIKGAVKPETTEENRPR